MSLQQVAQGFQIGGTSRDALVAIAIALISGLVAASPLLENTRGLSLDVLTALRWELFGSKHQPAASPTVVVAIDEESYQTPPFKGSPTLTWTREIDRKSTRLNSSHLVISYAVFCLKKKIQITNDFRLVIAVQIDY